MVNAITHNPNLPLLQKANEFVAQVFWGSLLREFRQGRAPTILDGGAGSQTFVRQLDMELLSRVSQKETYPLAEALLRQLDPNGIRRGLNLSRADNSYQHKGTTTLTVNEND